MTVGSTLSILVPFFLGPTDLPPRPWLALSCWRQPKQYLVLQPKLNKNWFWSQTPFEVFFIPQSEGYFLYQKDSRGEFFHDIQKQEWIYWYELPKLFETACHGRRVNRQLKWFGRTRPIQNGRVKDGEKYKDEELFMVKIPGKYDVGEYFEDADGDGKPMTLQTEKEKAGKSLGMKELSWQR